MTNYEPYRQWERLQMPACDHPVCVVCEYSGAFLRGCAVDECMAKFHTECSQACVSCRRPVCPEHIKRHNGHPYCPEDYQVAIEDAV